VISGDRFVEMQATVRRIEVSLPVRQYIVNLCRMSRSHPDVSHGVSPRGGAALQRAAQCHAAFSGRNFTTPDDVAAVAPSVMSHRLMMKPGFEEAATQAVAESIESTQAPT
jgi:MoxR-like ATPase